MNQFEAKNKRSQNIFGFPKKLKAWTIKAYSEVPFTVKITEI